MIGEAYCNKCAALAGKNGFECDRCAGLRHVKVEPGTGPYSGYERIFRCPKCRQCLTGIPGNLELCQCCDIEFVTVDPEEIE